MSKLTELIDAETAGSEATRDEPSRGTKQRTGTSAVYSLRLPADKIEKLQQLAESTGVLIRQWVIERLDTDPADAHSSTPKSATPSPKPSHSKHPDGGKPAPPTRNPT